MNLWDKDDDYYDPAKTAQLDELKHDDECPTCLRIRNGQVGRNSVRRPDGVITLGSPFVTFEKRWGGMLTALVGVWVYRILALLPLLGLLYYFMKGGTAKLPDGKEVQQSSTLWTASILIFPLLVYWLLGVHLVQRLRSLAERWLGKGDALFYVTTALQGFKYLLLAGVGLYYVVYATGSWAIAVKWLPFLGPYGDYLWWLTPLVLLWLLIVTLPGRFLRWMRDKVVALKEKLPKKYDPAEDRAVSYLSYHTLGDEAGLHLRIFSALTWFVQTLGLSAAIVLASGIFLTVAIGIEAFNHLVFKGSLLSKLGLSAWQTDQPALQDRFIQVMNWLTYFPAMVWSKLGVTAILNLGALDNARDVVWFIPVALLVAITLLFLFLMPLVLFLLAVAYVVSIRLRGSGLVFGSESFAWTMANRIGVKRNANDNTMLRRMFISPDAWRRQEIAHSYYYKSDRVIGDVASYMADWTRHEPSRFLPLGGLLADTARWAVVALFVLSIFAISVPLANNFASKAAAKPAQPTQQSTPEPEFNETDTLICRTKVHSLTIQVPPSAPEAAVRAEAQKKLVPEITAQFGAEWADPTHASLSYDCTKGIGETVSTCNVRVTPCKPRPIDCKDAPHAVEIGFDLSAGLDAGIRSTIQSSVMSTLKERWQSEVGAKFGPEWGDSWYNLVILRERHPVEEGCKEQAGEAGRISYQCKAATTPCKKPAAAR